MPRLLDSPTNANLPHMPPDAITPAKPIDPIVATSIVVRRSASQLTTRSVVPNWLRSVVPHRLWPSKSRTPWIRANRYDPRDDDTRLGGAGISMV
ncbi:MAG: hypothetical protein ACKV2Q_29115 [Planctomycetaceae bacterium]